MIKLLVVDDHPIVIAGIKQLLSSEKDIRVVGQARNGQEAVRRSRALNPDVILLDIGLPDIDGLEAARKLLRDLDASRVLIHTMHDDREIIREFIEMGVRGYILKGSPPSQLARAIAAVFKKRSFFSAELRKLAEDVSAHAKKIQSLQPPLFRTRSEYGLTPKEKVILAQVVQGLTMRQIAANLNLRYYTLTSHFKNLYAKLGVHTRGAVVAKALKERIL
jgi:DNA-binding NarL/FixJ family response regulator